MGILDSESPQGLGIPHNMREWKEVKDYYELGGTAKDLLSDGINHY